MNLCVDCAHHKIGNRCGNPDYAVVSLVDGRKKDASCEIQRYAFAEESCGAEGRGFDAKPKEEL